MSEEWRTFCAIELPEQVRARLQDHVRRLREAVPNASASWSRPENVHLTLKFFGNVRTRKIASDFRRSFKSHSQISSFSDLLLAGQECFQRSTQVLWIGVEDPSGSCPSCNDDWKTNARRKVSRKKIALTGRTSPSLASAGRKVLDELAETHLQTKFEY